MQVRVRSFVIVLALTCRPPDQFKDGGIHHCMRDKCRSCGLVITSKMRLKSAQRLRKINWSAMHASTSLVWSDGFLFPDKSNQWIQGIWLPMLLGDWDAIGEKSWGSAVLAGIYRELCTCSKVGAKPAGAAMFILQLWVWEHLPMFAPQDPRPYWRADDELANLKNSPYGVK
ncbi:unnamed protein product [Linum trigynum]|uniref:Aminotransferase-like plant mobile domain-containing protein n=1 Tax=Linum trigynum TaxID=586398 RepID=A0AAV2CNN9_9ROSI